MLQTSDLEFTGCKTYSCLDLTFWSRPVFSSDREDHSAILGQTPQGEFSCLLTPSGLMHQESVLGLTLCATGTRELLAISSPTAQGWEG